MPRLLNRLRNQDGEHEQMIERYRRYRAVHRYEYALRFWFFDSMVFFLKLNALLILVWMAFKIIGNLPHYGGMAVTYFESLQSAGVSHTRSANGEPSTPSTTASINTPAGAPIHLSVPQAVASKPVRTATTGLAIDEPAVSHQKIINASSLAATVKVKVKAARLRAGSSRNSSVLSIVTEGTNLSFLNYEGKWARVSTPAEGTGFIHRTLITPPKFDAADAIEHEVK